jgi:hypothetical protein
MLPRCCGHPHQLFEVPIEARAQYAPLGSVGASTRENDEIPRRQGALVAKRLAGEALEFVAVHGSSRSST